MRLNTDNPDTMPITDAVYGRKTVNRLPRKEQKPRRTAPSLGSQLPLSVLDRLSKLGGGATKRLAARRHQEER